MITIKKNDCKVAVIGGGISGLVIADGLQEKGYEKVTVFEKDNRVGGKLHTIWYKGKSYELGALFGLPSQNSLKALMKAHNIKNDGPKLSRVNYDASGNRIMQIPKEDLDDFVEELDRFPYILNEYRSLKRVNIHSIEDSLMLPFSKWCDINDFRVLKTVYVHYFTSYGLGDINVIPALYVLRILDYETLMSFMELPHFCTWEKGVSTFINTLKHKIKDIKLTQNVKEITKMDNGKICVHTEFEQLEYDKVVITAPLNQFTNLCGTDYQMNQYFGSIKYQDFNVYAFIVEKIPKKCGFVLENLSIENKGHVIIWNSRWDSSDGEELVMIYAYNSPERSKEESLKIIKSDLLKLGFVNPRFYLFKSWHQCPYVDTSTLKKGFYDKIEEMQGKNNIYIAGEIMSTVSMNNCIKFSNYILNRYF
ncbi:FAD-dependent oxidoreductase [Vallitalea maricola]|uniref:Uncharacterized protein n=1 Tax=Vallitalea maricola TaxID=3074433 RepID=A0ACB5UN79_9FIRM|nr:hypothetical protein AN2V17_34680 [Vallitalea sp. AN17-2]